MSVMSDIKFMSFINNVKDIMWITLLGFVRSYTRTRFTNLDSGAAANQLSFSDVRRATRGRRA